MFIVFEGSDNAGKTTQIKRLYKHLTNLGIKAISTAEPGGTQIGQNLRQIMFTQPLEPITELLLMSAARAEHVKHIINPALKEGVVVLCDRFTDSTHVYQGDIKQVPKSYIQQIERMIQPPKPDYVVLFTHHYGQSKDDLLGQVDQSKVVKSFLARVKDNWLLAPEGSVDFTSKWLLQTVMSKIPVPKNLSQV